MSEDNYPLGGPIRGILATVKDRSPHWGIIGFLIIAAILLGYGFRFLSASETFSQWLDRVVISLGFFVLLFGLIFREISRIRKEKYANVQEDVHGIQHIIRDQFTILSLMVGKTEEERQIYTNLVRQNVQECLNRFASVFTLLTGTKCRSTIKMITPGENTDKPVVYTYMRDVDSERFCDSDDNIRKKDGADLLEENTDFSTVFGEAGERWFFCNDLTTLPNYLNSRDPKLSKRNLSGWRGLLNLLQPVDWILSYRSNIVWPIRQKPIKEYCGSEFSFVGFLTIDSNHRRVFSQKFDTYLGASVADSLYYMLVKLEEVGAIGGANG